MSFIDLTGKVFGMWTVISRTNKKKTVRYLCKCSCGIEREVLSVSLRNGKSMSCGCDRPVRGTTGLSNTYKSTYNSWQGMKQRCFYPKHNEFHRYGGRGITISDRWLIFANFLEDMGEKPANMSLDRIDNNGNYCKENCRWSNRVEQSSNTNRNVLIFFDGKKFTLKQLAAHLGVKYDLLHNWHRDRGYPIEHAIQRALEQAPVGSNKPFVPIDL